MEIQHIGIREVKIKKKHKSELIASIPYFYAYFLTTLISN